MKKSHSFPIVLASVSLMICSLVSVPVSAEEENESFLKTELLKINETDDELLKLLKERRNTAVTELNAMYEEYQVGARTIDSLSEVSGRLLESELELSKNISDRITLYENYLSFRKRLEKFAELRYQTGGGSFTEFQQMKYWRLDAEIRLFKEKRKAEETNDPEK